MTFDITTFSDWVRRRRRTYYTYPSHLSAFGTSILVLG
jgi:hypothetical protein